MDRREFDRTRMHYFALANRSNKVEIGRSQVDPDRYELNISAENNARIETIKSQLVAAREAGASRMCVFGAHTIKNGLGPLLGTLVRDGWFTHLATNGAGIIHDWEFAYQGRTSEDVKANVQEGAFGTWNETGTFINLAIAVGAYEGLGYGESIGKLIETDGLDIPAAGELEAVAADAGRELSERAAALDLISEIRLLELGPGRLAVEHPYKEYSIQRICYENDAPFTAHPMFGHDIIYTHKANLGAAVGRTAEVDFLRFADSVERLENGVYLSIGSAVMSPMVFEKSMSMARNVLLQRGRNIKNANIHVVDIQRSDWDWSKGEPGANDPAYYHRFMKTFSRMGCPVDYTCMDNRDFLVALYRKLHG